MAQAIAWPYVDINLCRHMASLGHNDELIEADWHIYASVI